MNGDKKIYKRLIGYHFQKSKMLEMNRVQNVYSYDYRPFLKSYIDKNIINRKKAKTKSDSALFKLIQSMRKH